MAENELQRSTNKIMKWASETGFTISAEKTKTQLVHRRRPRVLQRSSLKIWMGERMLEMVRHHRMGLILDEKLNCKEHLKNVKARASKKLNLSKPWPIYNRGGTRRHC
jgi:putative SOS response-associated peptidase YedK